MTIGIIGAMDEEIKELKEKMSIKRFEKIANSEFVIGTLYNQNIVLVKCSDGKVNAAICAQILISIFKVDKIINIGVAGGIDNSLKIGEIVVSKNTVEYDFDTTAIGYELGYAFGVGKVYVDCDKEMYEKIYDISSKSFNTALGTIGSSDMFVSDEKIKEKLKNKFNLTAVDMETASINHVCYLNKIPFCSIRAISDTTSSMEFREFMEMAIENLNKVVTNYLKSI